MARRGLTPKQERFVAEYLRNGRNGAAAYRAAYGGKPSTRRATEEASKLVRHPNIAPTIAAADAKAAAATEKAADRYAVSKERVIAELARMAFANSADYRDLEKLTRDEWAAVSEVIAVGETAVKVKLHDKRAALAELAKVMGYVIDRKDVRIIKSLRDLTDEEVDAALAEFRSLGPAEGGLAH